MTNDIQKMINLYSLDTSCFYDKAEQVIHNKMLTLYKRRSQSKKLERRFKKNRDNSSLKVIKRIYALTQGRIEKEKNNLYKQFESHKGIRELNPDTVKSNKLVGMFETSLTRQLKIKPNTITKGIVIVQIYFFNVMEDIIRDGFTYNGEKYIYFSSSAGQIRTKKLVFIKEDLWNKYKNSITCGLTVDEINKKGGSNVNKYLAYIALTNSASEPYKNFDIDRCIVVDDLETKVGSVVDYINRDTYEITRKEEKIPIEHTDGAGMILPKKSNNSFMIRLPFMKGLLVPFPFDKFVEKHSDSTSKIRDIYGKKWDIFDDKIEIIFFKSQFKMWKYYHDWDDYKEKFKKFNCEASKLNEEDEDFKDARLNYQMIQTLSDIDEQELKKIAQPTIDEIENIANDEEIQLDILGAKDITSKSNYFQRAINKYPELLHDDYVTQTIRDKKKSLVKQAKSAKLKIDGKYTFICPDFYAVCEKIFLGKHKPQGLLNNGEVYCDLFENKKLDCLRSPHLYREHAVRKNMVDEDKGKWFVTRGLYTSIHDPISRILQFDVDGDKSLVVSNDTFVNIAERNMKDIYPLYYEMGVAEKEVINSENIYNSLILAFKANIGEYSNNITKIFNTKDKPNLKVVSWLTAENNFVIDYAKTLFMPKRPDKVDEEIKKYTKGKLPHFFIYAKDKKRTQVISEHIGVIDKLDNIIPNKRLFLRTDESMFDYTFLMREPYNYVSKDVLEDYKDLTKNKRKYMNRHFKNKQGKERERAFDSMARERLLSHGFNKYEVVNILVAALYKEKVYKNKTILWDSFEKELFKNVEFNTKGTKRCEGCKVRIKITSNRTKYCNDCQTEKQKKWQRESMKKYRAEIM